ncbi:ATP-dependent dethiobiotin synthetase BioD [Nonlabens sp. MIC269]|uniref:dethiobiotin synthase n=1 Tax=Nonlabens sp. MIC269 TaxID=1476901 RepID=UPI0007201FDB|nr:dethiobiotin synthase [Nonlabens sp. MIC269]ALM21014.1 ATP-dependent dethiobiotin synthetase BioD [Nonlabens sp. MIC269]
MGSYFITGIGTDVGKTVVAAIVTQALKADYWKPVQSGLDTTDKGTVASLVDNDQSYFHEESYRLNTPMSPHKSAEIDNVLIDLQQIKRPHTNNHLVIEGAGGLLVPLNQDKTIADLILPDDKIIVVSSGYLGSINHTLLTVESLKSRGLTCSGIIYNHVDLDGTIEVIEKMTGVPTLGHLKKENEINKQIINQYAQEFKETLHSL